MPIKPKTLEGIGKSLVYPFSSLKLMIGAYKGEPVIPGTRNVPFHVTPKIIEKLKEKKLDDLVDLSVAMMNDKSVYKKTDPAMSLLYRDILNNVVIKNGKPYIRNRDSIINSIRKLDSETIEKIRTSGGLSPEHVDMLQMFNSPFYGKILSKSDKIVDPAIARNLAIHPTSLNTSTIIARSAGDVGTKLKYPVLMNTDGGIYAKANQYSPQMNELILNKPLLTTPIHELSHAKDFKENAISRILPIAGDSLSNFSLVGTPLSILYGNRIADAIPGKADDALIQAFKYAGPEIWLAGQAMRHSPEFYATKSTKDVLKKTHPYYEDLASVLPGGGQSTETLIANQDMKARTYPSLVAGKYGLLRLGTLPLYLSKESSAAPKITVTPADYANVAKNEILRRVRSIKNLAIGMTDKEIWKGLLYHDSANKYTPISKVLPVSTLAAMVPLVALGEYYKDQVKPPPVIPGPSYKDSIKQGLGA